VIEAGAERWRRLTVKEGWQRFVADEPTERPERVDLGEYRRLDDRSRSVYDRERLRHAHGFGPIRSLYADVHRTLERLVVSNEVRGPGARHGAALDGNPGNGKTTIVSHFGRHYERHCRQRYPYELTADGHEYLPVVYVNVDALPTIKGLNHALLTFYGMGPPKRANARELTQLVLESIDIGYAAEVGAGRQQPRQAAA
jgi:Bacterial TniB protein